MKMLFIGAGAVGGYLGACLARSGHWVTLLGRAPVVSAVRERGLRVSMPTGGSWLTRNARAATTIDEVVQDSPRLYAPPFDAVFICVKAYDVDSVIAELRAYETISSADAGAGPLLVSFQNGVGSEEKFANAFGPERVISATLTSPVSTIEPGWVRLDRLTGGIGVAPLTPGGLPDLAPRAIAVELGRPQPDRLTLLYDVLRQSMIPVKCYRDYRSMKWSKMLLNILANASGAILDWTPREVYADRLTFGLEMAMVREALGVMRAAGIPVVDLPGAPAATFARLVRSLPGAVLQPLLVRQVAKGRGEKRPSFYYDVPRAGMPGAERKPRCEVAQLNGEIARHAMSLGVPAPVNARLTSILTSLVEGRADANDWRGQAGRLAAACGGD